MSNTKSLFATASVVTLGLLAVASTHGQDLKSGQARLATSAQFRTTDYMVPHISTVPANAGAWVELFLREKVDRSGPPQRPVVLMLHGALSPAVPTFDLGFENYSWMESLANAGFDVFAFDHTGYGLSPRPMMDNPCNVSEAEQKLYLVGTTLAQTCTPSHPFQLSTLASDVDEIDRIVDYIRELRGVDKVHLVGWSRGGNRAGAYAAKYPKKVDRMLLYAPGQYYSAQLPFTPPSPLPQPGVPTTIVGVNDFHNAWDTQVGCPNQYSPLIRDHINWYYFAFDPTGSTWGRNGVRRAPTLNRDPIWYPWNKVEAAKVVTSTLLINGDLDKTVAPVQVSWLYDDLVAVQQKILVRVACASHLMLWETQHEVLFDTTIEWLQKGTFKGQTSGRFAVDSKGQAQREATAVSGTSSVPQ